MSKLGQSPTAVTLAAINGRSPTSTRLGDTSHLSPQGNNRDQTHMLSISNVPSANTAALQSVPSLKRRLQKGHRRGFSTTLADSERKMTRNRAHIIKNSCKDADAFHLTRIRHGSLANDKMIRQQTQ